MVTTTEIKDGICNLISELKKNNNISEEFIDINKAITDLNTKKIISDKERDDLNQLLDQLKKCTDKVSDLAKRKELANELGRIGKKVYGLI